APWTATSRSPCSSGGWRCSRGTNALDRIHCNANDSVSAMWIVRLALRRPYTFIVMAIAIVILGVLAIVQTPTDIFPTIDIPVISVIWNYGGLPPEQMEKRIVSNFERFLTTIVDNVDHVESQSLTGIAVIKIYLQPNASVDNAVAQTTAIAQTAVRSMPPG